MVVSKWFTLLIEIKWCINTIQMYEIFLGPPGDPAQIGGFGDGGGMPGKSYKRIFEYAKS